MDDGPGTTDPRRQRWRRFFERASALQFMAIYWIPLTLLVGLPVRWLFDRHEPLAVVVLDAAQSCVWIGPALYLSRRVVGPATARDPEGQALRQALRSGTLPADGRLRAGLPE